MVGRAVLAQLIFDDFVGVFLQIGIKRGTHGKNTLITELLLLGELLHLVIGVIEIPFWSYVPAAIDWGRRIAQRPIDLSLSQIASLDHIVQDIGCACARRRQIDMWRIFCWRLEETGDHRRFGKREIAHGFAEVELRRSLYPKCAASEIGTIEIEPQYFASWQTEFEPDGEISFFDLALQRPPVRKEKIFCQLLSDGRAALDDRICPCINGQGAQRSDHVDPKVLEKSPVFCCDNRVNQILGKLIE